jgi:predicted nuclease of restriction endonuclease-like (RecB) superfamily
MMIKKVKKRSVSDALFGRVAAILEQARSNVVRTVNTTMVTAYWLIGREIVQAIQGGRKRAEYGQQIIEELSVRLTERYGKGYSSPTLWNFRQFYQVYADRNEILSPTGRELNIDKKLSLPGRESGKNQHPAGGELAILKKQYPAGTQSPIGFSPVLSWSHYRALMRVEEAATRDFYEKEAAECGWSKSQLERQIQSCYYERIIANRGRSGLAASDRKRLCGEVSDACQIIKSPYVLEFLGLPDTPGFHETQLEQAIIDNLQTFLLELGKGFSFVARQKHIRFDEDDFYVDLVFYNYILKCFLLIDLKIGKLTHQDVGQMDGYVRLFEDRFKTPGDNPTIGLILCSSKSEAVAKYSVLKEGRQIFASKYLQFLPTEKQLRLEIKKERRLLESGKKESDDE